MSDLVETALLKKLEKGELASLYLISYNAETTDPVAWVDHFQKELTPIQDHPDVLRLFKGPKENEYKVDSGAIKDLIKFISTRPLQLEKKFVFLFDAHDLSVVVSNKLLKVFEELGGDYCLILFAPKNSSLLETVLSRAVKLTLASPESEIEASSEEEEFHDIKSPQELINYFRESEGNLDLEKKYIEHALKQCLAQAQSNPSAASFKQMDELLSLLKEYETRLTFNNSKLSRLTPFFP